MKNLFIGMIALLMLGGASCSAQRVIPADSTKHVTVIYDAPWHFRPHYGYMYHRGEFRHQGKEIIIKKDQRPEQSQYRKGEPPMQYRGPRMHQGMRGNMPMSPQMQNRMHNGQGMGQMRGNTNSQIKKDPYDMPMEDFINYINYKE